ncbi:hypothetical protein QBC37DRAFT_409055 [Rhypophila decipiens]|uniref:Infection structure specific protein n=1 Tax=Rhypophila decipiens TaxID=261697 RepID=A0AAN6YIP5_9PEZI|nr:hypothetical protein QBC37DRAFT_409055 [Rhypophila decipiens]
MRTTAILLAITAPSALAHVFARQAASQAPAPAPVPAPTHNMDHETMDHPKPTAVPTPTRPAGYSDLAKCELAIDTLLRAFSGVPTPNAALSAFLATETVQVADPCQWASDVPDGLQGAYSAYSRGYVQVLSEHADLTSQLQSCVDAGGASVTRAEIVTPLFGLPDCVAPSTTGAGGGPQSTAAVATTSTTRGFPTGSSSTAGGVKATGVAMAGVFGAALLGAAGVL